MTYYHPKKEQALAAGEPFAEHFHIRAEMVPYNGWVLILAPKTMAVFDWALAPLLEIAEVELAAWPRIYRRPEGHKRVPPIPTPERSQRPSKGRPEGSPRKSRIEVVELTGEQKIKPSWM